MASKTTANSPLLTLPAELRNRIYRLALCKRDGNTISTNVVPEPPLLATCKQIRNEATAIFYRENDLVVDVGDYDSTPIMAVFHKHLASEKLGIMRRVINGIPRRPNWDNMVLWLFRTHKYGETLDLMSRIPRLGPPTHPRSAIVVHLFQLVLQLRDLPWTRVEHLLQEYRWILHTTERGWMEQR